nr:unnamed protein product [Spirometra erinaceieuropaei]
MDGWITVLPSPKRVFDSNFTGDRFSNQLVQRQAELQAPDDNATMETMWRPLRNVIHSSAMNLLGRVRRQRQEWFDDVAEIADLLVGKNGLHNSSVNNASSLRCRYLRVSERVREQRAIRDAALENKFRKLPNPASPKNDKLVHNLSSKELTKEQMQVLRHEASLSTADAKPVNVVAAVESVLSQTEAMDEAKNLIRHQVSSLLMAHRPREVLSNVERTTLKGLKADKELVIVPADKGRSTVVFDRTDHLQKAKRLLEDQQSYVFCATNPVKTLTRGINATLLALENSRAISPTDRHMAGAQDTALARLSGLLKVHKVGVPSGPSFHSKTYFTFDGTVYEQVKGTPMGSPISGLIAEAVLQQLESLVFRHHRPKFWARYKDDTFVIIERDRVMEFKEHLNAIFSDIQFTMEEEENNQLAFLDVLVCRKDCSGLKTKVFRKATNTTQVLICNSNHPISYKRSCIRTLSQRVETHCSEPEDKVAELQ